MKSENSSWNRMFRWLSIAPLGGPVVPEVYTRMARSSGWAISSMGSNAPGCSLS